MAPATEPAATPAMPAMPATPAPLPALSLSGVTLRYRIPREVVVTFKEYALRKLRGRMEHNTLVALRDISFTVAPGESVGIIGANGAGKSSLFRLIARVRRPTEGRLVVRGRVAPLLELGLGFHGDLTGRENIVLQGTLLGFSRRDMADRTPAIASFAELEEFLDVPVRTYSTGMAARLAFAVATDVDPDILLVDEALSVGDVRFRAKCRARMAEFKYRGKTFLLVSHARTDITENCRRALWIAEGRILRDGPADEVCAAYDAWAQGGTPA